MGSVNEGSDLAPIFNKSVCRGFGYVERFGDFLELFAVEIRRKIIQENLFDLCGFLTNTILVALFLVIARKRTKYFFGVP
jgi:hypothetical protein